MVSQITARVAYGAKKGHHMKHTLLICAKGDRIFTRADCALRCVVPCVCQLAVAFLRCQARGAPVAGPFSMIRERTEVVARRSRDARAGRADDDVRAAVTTVCLFSNTADPPG